MTEPATPHDIRYETKHYLVRRLVAGDASERACAWLANPDTARNLNVPARRISLAQLRTYFARHDGIRTHVLGMFDKLSGALLGMWTVYVDWQKREFQLNVLVGERGPTYAGGIGARRETGLELYRIMFEDLDLLLLRATVLARNEKMERRFEQRGIAPERTSLKPSLYQAEPEQLHHYTMSREDWRKLRQQRLDRERAQQEAARDAG